MNKVKFTFLISLLALQLVSISLYSSSEGHALVINDLNLSLEANFSPPPDTIIITPSERQLKGEALLHKVNTNNRFIGILAPNQAHELPVGIQRVIAGVEYTIVLDDLILDKAGASMKAYMTIQVPGSDRKLGFYADNVRVGPNGIETAQLKLIKDEPVPLGAFSLIFKSEETMVEWDCNGYSSTTIGGDVVFPSEMIKPVSGEVGDSVAMGHFYANFTDINDLFLGFDMEPFEINGLPNFEFHPQGVFIDMSDIRNPQGMIFPSGFFPSNQPQQLNVLWRGVFIPSFTVKLPEGLGAGGQDRLEIVAENLLIDVNGITGDFLVNNLLPIEQGTLGGWGFSIDTFGLTLFKNTFSGFSLNGNIKIPITEQEEGFAYSAMIDNKGDLFFSVSYADQFDADFLGAQITLSENSTIEIVKEGNKFKPKAILHGNMSIGLSDEVSLGTFEFQDMVISTESPYFSIGTCSLPNGLLAGFPVSISKLSFLHEGDSVGLSMESVVSFMPSNENGFGGTGSFIIWAERLTENGRTKYRYKNTQVNKIVVDVNQGGFDFHGEVEFYQQHAVYGKGFKGMIQASFPPGISVTAAAQFGSVDGYRYWYVDALVSKSSGIPIFSGVAIYGFGGGASYKMKLQEPASYSIPEGNFTGTDNTKNPGISFSGATYTPNSEYGLGLKASVILGTHPSPKAVNGQVSFRIQFYAGGGIESVKFKGEACMASNIGSNPKTAPIRLTMDISYNFTNSDLYGVNEAFVNLVAVKGIHSNNKAGSVIFRFNPNEWYIHVGTPDSRIGLKVLNIFSFASYFMVGTNIPPFPAPPDNVTQIISGTNAQSFEGGLMSTGSGFAFGSSFDLDTGEQHFLIFYGAFSLGTGFDIMLKDYGSTAYCEGSPPPLGVNGWYAMGQAYAYMSGKVGVQFRLFGKSRKMDILAISAAALLQAKLPNPIYFKGQAGGEYNIMGGLIKGSCKFDFSVGHNCEVMGANPLGNIAVIADISPTEGNSDVSVFVTPQVAFNLPIDDPFTLVDENNETQTFRIKLSKITVLADNSPIQGSIKWNAAKDVASFETQQIYPSFANVEFLVRVVFQKYQNNQWVDFRVSGQLQTEEQTISFVTGERPDHIPSQCVVYTYPIAGMMNFHWREHSTGYIKLTHNFDYLLNPEAGWENLALFDSSNEVKQAAFSYNSANLKITFAIPNNLEPQMVYSFRVAKMPTTQIAAVDANVSRVSAEQTIEYEVSEQSIEGEREVSLERKLFELNLRTSMFATFTGKLDAMQLSTTSKQIVTTGIHNLIQFADFTERFDAYEVQGSDASRLIQCEISLEDNTWYNQYIKPLVYQNYPRIPELSITWRDADVYGVPPVRSIYCYQTANVTDIETLQVGTTYHYPKASMGIKYTGVVTMNQDYQYMKGQASSMYKPGSPHANILLPIIDGFFTPILVNQRYKATLKYVLPGEGIVTSEKELTFDI